MKLLKLGKIEYAVYAVYDEDDRECPVMTSLQELSRHNKAAERMLHKLRTYIPESGPNFRNPDKVKKLKGVEDIWEFREQPKRGPKIRVLFFQDEKRVIVCTNAFEKNTGKTPTANIDAALSSKERYFQAKGANEIEIEEIESDTQE